MEEKASTKKIYMEIVGWYGAFAILLAYALVSFKMIEADSAIYQLLNLTGAIGIIIVSVIGRVYQPAVLNAFWAVIAIVALAGIIF